MSTEERMLKYRILTKEELDSWVSSWVRMTKSSFKYNKVMNDNPNIESSESQNKRILDYLKKGNRLTSLEALRMFGCMRLASRISDIRKNHPDINIVVDRIETATKKKVAQYYVLK